MTARRVAWRGDDDPHRWDAAELDIAAGGITGHGISITRDYALAWALDASAGSATRSLRVTVDGAGWSRRLLLERTPEGEWSTRADTTGRGDLDDPGATTGTLGDAGADCASGCAR